MGILQAAVLVIGHVHTQILFIQGVPDGGNILDFQRAADQLLFDLVTDHHVEAIGQLVGLGADEGGLCLVDCLVELLGSDVLQLFGEEALHPGINGLNEGQGAADEILIESGLALVHTHGHAAGQTVVVVSRVDSQLIQGVTTLVDYRVHGKGQLGFGIMGGDAHILTAEIQGEGVLGLTDGRVIAIHAQHFHQIVGELPLIFNGIDLVQEAVVDLLRLTDLPDDGHQTLPQGAEEHIQLIHGHAALIFVEQGIVGSLFTIIIGGKLPVKGHQLFQNGLEQGEVGSFLGAVPHIAGLVHQLGVLHIFIGRDAGKLVVVAAQQLHLTSLLLIQLLLLGLQIGDQFAGFGRGKQLVLLTGQNAQCHAAALGGVPGSHRHAVQIEGGGGGAEGV